MSELVLPDKITIQLTDDRDQSVKMSDVIFSVHLFARRKNDFLLGPYLSNKSGIVLITQADLKHDVDATYDSGLMDYVSVETCYSFVEIVLDHPEDIQKALKSRQEVWKNLLKGEKERWGSIKNLLKAYRKSKNKDLNVWKGFSRIRDEWDGSKREYNYTFPVNIKV